MLLRTKQQKRDNEWLRESQEARPESPMTQREEEKESY